MTTEPAEEKDREVRVSFILRRMEALFGQWGVDSARGIPIGQIRADLVAYGYPKAVVVLIRVGKADQSVSFSAVTEAIILRGHAQDALDRETIALLLTTQRVPDPVREALREWAISVVQVTDRDEIWERRVRQEMRELGVLL